MKTITDENWGQQTKTVTLTNNQITALESYIISSSYYRQSECNDSETLLAMNNEDTELHNSAKSNIAYYLKLEKELETIVKALNN